MKYAVIFDMDGVMIDSESLWDVYQEKELPTILTPEVAKQIIGHTKGLSESLIYKKMVEYGHTGTKEELYTLYDRLAEGIYSRAPLMPGADALISDLYTCNVSLGLVSSSPRHWIDAMLKRLPHADAFSFIESVNEHPDLKPKPAPDGYIEAMRSMNVLPAQTFIIEDSRSGLRAAKEAGAVVCCYTQFMQEKPEENASYVYAHNENELHALCMQFIGKSR